jgi:hypothetical protein
MPMKTQNSGIGGVTGSEMISGAKMASRYTVAISAHALSFSMSMDPVVPALDGFSAYPEVSMAFAAI